MSEPLAWNHLSRAHQKVLARVWAGGTIRNQDPSIVVGLQLMGYMQGDKLSTAGDQLCSEALITTMKRVAEAAATSGPKSN